MRYDRLGYGDILARLPETIRQRLVELAQAHEGFVSKLDINQEFSLAGYGENKREIWMLQWLANGLIKKKIVSGLVFFSFMETEEQIKAGKQYTLDKYNMPVRVHAAPGASV